MTPPPPPPPRGRGRRGDDELEHVVRRSRQRRARTRGKRKRRTTLIFVILLVIVLAVIASSVGAVARFRSDCNLNDLKAVQIGENSFVYAANGSLLGAILGYETGPRVGQALGGLEMISRGWHSGVVFGTLSLALSVVASWYVITRSGRCFASSSSPGPACFRSRFRWSRI
jgi:hypothetical protein